jgi:hypothetical protein
MRIVVGESGVDWVVRALKLVVDIEVVCVTKIVECGIEVFWVGLFSLMLLRPSELTAFASKGFDLAEKISSSFGGVLLVTIVEDKGDTPPKKSA